MIAPVIETARLRLRAHRASDLVDCVRLWADPDVTRHIGRVSTRQETWSRVLRYAGHWALLNYGYWVVEEKESGAFAGEVGFADFKREIVPPIEGVPETGWVLLPAMQGKGYATEAVGAALAWADVHFRSDRTVCIVAPENAASIRVARKCGYEEYARTTYGGVPAVMFERFARRSAV
jgi:RimJ/RimL family protein N-acetyltransferase